MFNFFKKRNKEVKEYLGSFNSKPYHYFKSNMTYAKDVLIYEDNKASVYSRYYKGTVFVFTFVEDESDFDKTKFNYEQFKEQIDKLFNEKIDSVINLIIFKNKNEKTISIAKEKTINTQTVFNQTLVYDENEVKLLYYRPVPNFYKLYAHYAEAIYFDLAVIDPTRS